MTPDDRELRLLRMEQRSMQEEVEFAAAQKEAAQLTLDMALFQLGNRSTELTVETAQRDFRGTITHVGEDIATLHSVAGPTFELVIDCIVGVRYSEGSGTAQAVSAGHPRTLLGRLRDLVVTESAVTVGRRLQQPVSGTISSVTPTHAEVLDARGTIWLIPINQIAWLGPPVS